MAYEKETIEQSQAIFYYLLEHHQLEPESAKELYEAYMSQDAVQELVKSQGKFAHCIVKTYDNVIYLIPDEDNYFLGYSKGQLKKELCRSNATDKDYHLAQFAILVLMLEFYDGQGSSSKTRDFIRIGDLQNYITEKLKEGIAKYSEEEQALNGFAFSAMYDSYESLHSEESSRRRKYTKEGFMYPILRFLQEQGLIDYIEQDDMVKTTKKFDNLMDWNLLNKNNYYRVQRVLGVEEHE